MWSGFRIGDRGRGSLCGFNSVSRMPSMVPQEFVLVIVVLLLFQDADSAGTAYLDPESISPPYIILDMLYNCGITYRKIDLKRHATVTDLIFYITYRFNLCHGESKRSWIARSLFFRTRRA